MACAACTASTCSRNCTKPLCVFANATSGDVSTIPRKLMACPTWRSFVDADHEGGWPDAFESLILLGDLRRLHHNASWMSSSGLDPLHTYPIGAFFQKQTRYITAYRNVAYFGTYHPASLVAFTRILAASTRIAALGALPQSTTGGIRQ